jgi:RecA-family ATPase
LPLGKVGLVLAEGGAGKTMALFQLAVSVATAGPWLGAFTVAIPDPKGPRPGRVLLIIGEEDADEAHRRCYRVRAAVSAPEPRGGSIVVLPLEGLPCAMLANDLSGDLAETSFLAGLRTWLGTSGPWDLIVVDPLSRFAGPDAEKDNAAGTRFIQALESLATLTGATVLASHHTSKLARRGGEVGAVAGRGASALVDGARWVCSLGVERLALDGEDERERLAEVVTWALVKTNYSRPAEPLCLRRSLDHGGALVALDADDLALVEKARGRDAAHEAKERRKDAAETEKCAREDQALDAILSAPDAPTTVTDIRAALRAALGSCSNERAGAAVARRKKAGREE